MHLRNTDACEYLFSPHDLVGWVMVGGSPSGDRFADDPTLSVPANAIDSQRGRGNIDVRTPEGVFND